MPPEISGEYCQTNCKQSECINSQVTPLFPCGFVGNYFCRRSDFFSFLLSSTTYPLRRRQFFCRLRLRHLPQPGKLT